VLATNNINSQERNDITRLGLVDTPVDLQIHVSKFNSFPEIITIINLSNKLPSLAHIIQPLTFGSCNMTIKKHLKETRNHQLIVYCSNNSPLANTWLIAHKIPTPIDKQQRLTQLSRYITHKPNAPYFLTTLDTHEAYARLGIDGEALNPNQATPVPLSNGVPAQALHVNGLTPHVVQEPAFLMTLNPCAGVADLKLVCKDILRCVSPHYITDYNDLQFT